MAFCLKLFGVSGFLFCCAGDSFYMIFVAFLYHFGVILVTFWCHFGVPGGLLAALGPPKGPLKGPSRTSYEKVGFWSLFDHPKGSLWRHIFGNFCVFFDVFSNDFSGVLFGGLLGFRGTPSNHETKGVVYTKPSFSHLHLYSKNYRKPCPIGTLLAPFGVQNAEKGGTEKIKKKSPKTSEKSQAKSCRTE